MVPVVFIHAGGLHGRAATLSAGLMVSACVTRGLKQHRAVASRQNRLHDCPLTWRRGWNRFHARTGDTASESGQQEQQENKTPARARSKIKPGPDSESAHDLLGSLLVNRLKDVPQA